MTTGADLEVDLLVLGAGGAGMTAALVGAIEGLRVLVCEKTSQVGGTTARSSGGVWIPGSDQSRDAGLADSIADARRYLAPQMAGLPGDAARELYLRSGPEALSYLQRHTRLQFVPTPAHPDYQPHDGAAVGGRPLGHAPFDGRELGRDFARVASPLPELTALGGMMIGRDDIPHLLHPLRSARALAKVARMVGRHLVDRLTHARGTRLLMGNAMAARLYASLRDRQVPVWFEAHTLALLQEQGRVVGATVRVQGELRHVRARCGVVLATGGYSHGAGWRHRLMTPVEQHVRSLTAPGATGDGLALAQACGAVLDTHGLRRGVLGCPVSTWRRADGSEALYPHLFLDRPKPGVIAVNRAGRRFVNEAASYHDFVDAMLGDAHGGPHVPAHLVCTLAFVRRYGLGAVLPGGRNLRRFARLGYVMLADSLDELARRIGVDPVGLQDTVARHNRFATSGVDEDFGKGSTAFNRFHGDASRLSDARPNPCLGAIDQAPYVALRVWPGDMSTFTGLRTTPEGEVLDAVGTSIPGLYACGNDRTSPWRGHAPGPGVTLGPALVFAWHAARHAARGGTRSLRPSQPATPETG